MNRRKGNRWRVLENQKATERVKHKPPKVDYTNSSRKGKKKAKK